MAGNKRSGTSFLVRLLNSHPKMFIAHEADLVWLLYQIRRGEVVQPARYRWDGDLGMLKTWRRFQETLTKARDTRQAIGPILEAVLRDLMGDQFGESKEDIAWLGDKKPVQHADPKLMAFIEQNLPDAKYLHIVRHPRDVIASQVTAAGSWESGLPPFWRGGHRDLLRRWTIHEKWILSARQRLGSRLHSLRFEDLLWRPSETCRALHAFLELPPEHDVERWARQNSLPPAGHVDRDMPPIECPRALSVMRHYEYAA